MTEPEVRAAIQEAKERIDGLRHAPDSQGEHEPMREALEALAKAVEGLGKLVFWERD